MKFKLKLHTNLHTFTEEVEQTEEDNDAGQLDRKNLRKKILVLSVACVSVRAHVIHLYTIWGPFPYKFMSTIAVCCQHFLTIKRTVAGE